VAAAALGVALIAVGIATAAATADRSGRVTAKLRGKAETLKGSPTGFGNAVIKLSTKSGKACWTLSVHRLDTVLSAHIHKASAGKNGPVVVPLGDRFRRTGCVSAVPRRTILAILARPSAYYVNVHTKKYLNGAIRGQLEKS
jgi:hypothetical protein